MKTFRVTDSQKFSSNRRVRKNGFLQIQDCVIARSGVLQYSDVQTEDGNVVADGDLITVYRPPESLKRCVKDFNNLPLTLTHPEGDAVTPENAKGLVVGALSTNARGEMRDDGEFYIVCDMIVYDAQSQQAIEDGDYEELSAGYETAFQQKRGTSPSGQVYEAIQSYLSPNHVALVEKGRCGSSCKVSDHQDTKLQTQTEKKQMRITKKQKASRTADSKVKNASYRFFIQKSDDDEEVQEVSPEVAETLMDEDPKMKVEELDEEDVKLVPDDEEDIANGKEVEDEEPEAFAGKETPEEEALEKEQDEDVPGTEDKEDEGEGGLVEVQFDDGAVGKCDQVCFDHIQRLQEVTKRGDSVEKSFGKLAILTSEASKILGSEFEISKFAIGDSISASTIKRAVIKKVFPMIVGFKKDAIDALYDSAVATHKKADSDWQSDMSKLSSIGDKSNVGNEPELSFSEKARQDRIAKLHGKNKE